MNCYQVGAMEVMDGLPAMRRPNGCWVVKVGFNPYQEVLVSRRRSEQMDYFMDVLERRAKGSTNFVRLLDEDGFVSPEVAQEAIGEVTSGGLAIKDLDWDNRKELLVDRFNSRVALVLVTVCVNRESTLQYLANSYKEVKLNNGNTVKVNYGFERATGVDTIALGVGFYGEPLSLLRVGPGSGFRLRQTKPFEGGWEEMSLTWTGRELKKRPFWPRAARARA